MLLKEAGLSSFLGTFTVDGVVVAIASVAAVVTLCRQTCYRLQATATVAFNVPPC